MRELTPQEMSRLAEVHLTKSDLEVHMDLHPEESFETAVSYLVDLRQRIGVPPAGSEQTDLPTTDGEPAKSTPVTELDPSDPQYVKTDENGWPVKEEAPATPAEATPAIEPES